MTKNTCAVEGCEKPRKGTLCHMHAARLRRNGTTGPAGTLKVQTPAHERVLRRCIPAQGGCVVFTGRKRQQGGYLMVGLPDGSTGYAHRVVYEALVGPIPDGFHIDHLCRNRACVNPAHMEAVTPQTNNLRSTSRSAINARKTHCKNGHPFSGRNLIVTSTGSRKCRTCYNAYMREKRRTST